MTKYSALAMYNSFKKTQNCIWSYVELKNISSESFGCIIKLFQVWKT